YRASPVENTNSGRTLTVDQTIDAGSGNVTPTEAWALSLPDALPIVKTTGTLDVVNTNSGDIALGGANVVSAFTGSNTVGKITFVDNVADLRMAGTLATNMDISIQKKNAGGTLTVNQTIDAEPGNVTM